MSKPPINETAVLMATAHLFTSRCKADDDAWIPFKENRARELTLDECAQMAWAMACAVRKFNPESGTVLPFANAPRMRPAPWDRPELADPKTLAANDK